MPLLRLYLLACLLCLFGCASGRPVSRYQTLEAIKRNPNGHIGTLIAADGDAMSVQESNNVTTFQVISPPLNLVVTYRLPAPFVRDGSNVTFLGRITGESSGTNAYGGTVRVVTLDAIALATTTGGSSLRSERATVQAWNEGTLRLP